MHTITTLLTLTCDDAKSVTVEWRLDIVAVGGLAGRAAGWVVTAAAAEDDERGG